MMSQTTASLLANMAMDVSLHAAPPAAAVACGSTATSGILTNDPPRRPLRPMDNTTIIDSNSKNKTLREMGPNELLYRQNYDGFVSKLIRSYSTRSKNVVSTKRFAEMNANERQEAMVNVERWLLRWNGDVTRDSLHPGNTSRADDEAMKSAMASATTAEERQDAALDPSTSLLEESMVLLSDDESNGLQAAIAADGASFHNHRGKDEEEDSTFLVQKTNQSDSPSTVSSIERTRHSQKSPPAARRNDHDERILASPEVFSHSHAGKRCASHSGKRGLKSRYRAGSEDAESALLRLLNKKENGAWLEEGEEEASFSCGSPIERRFSEDFSEEERDTVSEWVGRKERGHDEGQSEEVSRFSLQEDVGDFGADCDGGEEGRPGENETVSQARTALPRGNNQQSQWSAFQNADPKFTWNPEEEDESPVRRREIRFDAYSQRMACASSCGRNGRDVSNNDDSLSMEGDQQDSLHEKMADMAVNEQACARHNEDDGDDPIQTVRNLSRRAKALESQGIDPSLLDEVAPTDIRLREGAHFRMDPLRCRQRNDKSESQQQRNSKSVKKKQPPQSKSVMKSNAKRNPARVVAAADHSSSESENSLSDPEPSFIDPLSRFPSRVAARLNVAFHFLTEKERGAHHYDAAEGIHVQNSNIGHNESCGVLLSMSIQQIVSITSKLLLQTIHSARSHQRTMNSFSTKLKRLTPHYNLSQEKEVLGGGTLIVLRCKDDIAQWEVALREYTSLSVINHAELQSNLRKLANTAAKCAGFDVVLTTYDAMKAKEVTVPVNEYGCAVLDRNTDTTTTNAEGDGGGWLTSRASGSQCGAEAPRKCHQLSVLHRMSWHRVILMDVLGRQGFLTKPGTARAQAAVAINALSRFIIFEKEGDAKENGKSEEKFKDDRRQLRSVTTALQLPTSLKLDKFLSHYVMDIHKVGRDNDPTLCHDELSDSNESVSEDGHYFSEDENLTEAY